MSCLEALHRLALGIGGWYGFTADALMQVGRLGLPEATAVMEFAERDVAEDSLRLLDKILPANQPLIQVTYEPNMLLNGPLNLAPGKAAALLRPYAVMTGDPWAAFGSPLDDYPGEADYVDLPAFHSLFSYSGGETLTGEVTRLVTLYEKILGVFQFQTKLSATRLSIGETISLSHSRLGWKEWTASDPASPENTQTIDSRLAVVIGIDVNEVAAKPLDKGWSEDQSPRVVQLRARPAVFWALRMPGGARQMTWVMIQGSWRLRLDKVLAPEADAGWARLPSTIAEGVKMPPAAP